MKKLFYLIIMFSVIVCEEKEVDQKEEKITSSENCVFFCGLTEEESAFLSYFNSLDILKQEELISQCLEDVTRLRSILKNKNGEFLLKGDLTIKALHCRRSVHSLADHIKARYSRPDLLIENDESDDVESAEPLSNMACLAAENKGNESQLTISFDSVKE
jgi:hypothetical protein